MSSHVRHLARATTLLGFIGYMGPLFLKAYAPGESRDYQEGVHTGMMGSALTWAALPWINSHSRIVPTPEQLADRVSRREFLFGKAGENGSTGGPQEILYGAMHGVFEGGVILFATLPLVAMTTPHDSFIPDNAVQPESLTPKEPSGSPERQVPDPEEEERQRHQDEHRIELG